MRSASPRASISPLLARILSGGWPCALLFVALGSVFIGRTGIEEDEAIFASPLYRDWCFYAIPFRHGRIPIMHMSYVGALKTWLYTPIAAIWQPGAAMLRVPALLIGGLTILLFWKLLDSVHGRSAAWIGSLLLATDPVFLLTNVFDWGPVAIQHVLLVVMLLCSVQWARSRNNRWLFTAALCCGLAFWDKAVFIWMFSGLMAGSLLFWRLIRDRFTWRRAGIVVLGLALGGAPLIDYNLSTNPKFLTFRANAHFTPHQFAGRFQLLRATWSGPALFGYMVYDSSDRPKSPQSQLERASFALHGAAGDRRRDYFEWALIASGLLIPLLWRTKARVPLLFTAIAGAVAWTVMVLLDGGGSVHHTVLLWPFPQWLVAISVAEASRHWRYGKLALAVAVSFLVITNLLVVNQYLFRLIRNGAAGSWTDAIYPLATAVAETHASQVALVDWGFQDPLSFLNRATPPERVIADPFMPTNEPESQKKADLQILLDREAIWVEHTAGNEAFPGINARLLAVARAAGLEQAVVGTLSDSNGQPIFQIFRFVPHPGTVR